MFHKQQRQIYLVKSPKSRSSPKILFLIIIPITSNNQTFLFITGKDPKPEHRVVRRKSTKIQIENENVHREIAAWRAWRRGVVDPFLVGHKLLCKGSWKVLKNFLGERKCNLEEREINFFFFYHQMIEGILSPTGSEYYHNMQSCVQVILLFWQMLHTRRISNAK